MALKKVENKEEFFYNQLLVLAHVLAFVVGYRENVYKQLPIIVFLKNEVVEYEERSSLSTTF